MYMTRCMLGNILFRDITDARIVQQPEEEELGLGGVDVGDGGWHGQSATGGEGAWKPVITCWVHWEFWIKVLGLFPLITFWSHLECNHNMCSIWNCWEQIDHIWNVISTCFLYVTAHSISNVPTKIPKMFSIHAWWVHFGYISLFWCVFNVPNMFLVFLGTF